MRRGRKPYAPRVEVRGRQYGLVDTLRVIIGASKKIYEASKEASI